MGPSPDGTNATPRARSPRPTSATHSLDRKESKVNASRPVTVDDYAFMTADGYAQLCAELEALRTVRRQKIADQLRDAREDADPENPVLFELLEELAQLEGRIKLLAAQVAAARIVTPTSDGSAGIGSCVRVRHRESGEVAEYDLVGPTEAGVGNGRVSIAAPVGRALVGRQRGDIVAANTPRGTVRLEILGVRPVSGRMKEAA
jgi:transcription elongation factor GreA